MRALALAFVLAFCSHSSPTLAMTPRVPAGLGDLAKKVAKAGKSVGKKVGKAGKHVGKKVGKGAKEASKKVAKESKKAARAGKKAAD